MRKMLVKNLYKYGFTTGKNMYGWVGFFISRPPTPEPKGDQFISCNLQIIPQLVACITALRQIFIFSEL